MELVRQYALSFSGTPYHYGGSSPAEGLDCSRLVIEILTAFGLLPFNYNTNAQGLSLRFPDKVESADLGDLSFYGSSLTSIGHVGFCLNESIMLEEGGGQTDTVTLQKAIERHAFCKIRPIHYRKDFLFIARPPWAL